MAKFIEHEQRRVSTVLVILSITVVSSMLISTTDLHAQGALPSLKEVISKQNEKKLIRESESKRWRPDHFGLPFEKRSRSAAFDEILESEPARFPRFEFPKPSFIDLEFRRTHGYGGDDARAERRSSQNTSNVNQSPSNPFHGQYLFGDWGGFRSNMAEKGVNVEFSFTQFVQTISGDKPDTFDHFPNRFDLMVNVDTEKVGLWKGGGIGTHVETRFGGPPTGIALYPANTALITPTTGEGRVVVSGLYVTQKLGKTSSIMFGKINMLDLLAPAPFMGGRGIDGFMHIAFAGPPSGVAPVSTYGALFSTKFKKKYGFSLLVFDPQDQTGWHKPFTEGINFSPSFVIPAKTFGHNATHTFGATFSTQEGTNLADLPQVILPPEQQQIGTKRGPFNINYTYEQYFFQNPDNPAQGWGMFAKFAIADGNPNSLQNTVEIGIGGTGLFPGRKLDRFGVGYFSLGLSDALKDFLQPLSIPIRRERGFETFYNFAVTRWLRVTGDIQVLPATIVGRDTKVFGAVRTKISF